MRRVLVTAGGAGIGLAIAKAFAELGDRVAICDRDGDALRLASRIVPDAVCLSCDVSDCEQVDDMMSKVDAEFGDLDVLVNNAGVAGPTTPVRDLGVEDWNRVLAVSLTGAFLVTRAAIPLLTSCSNGDGASIINMSAAAGRFGYANRSAYSAAKWGIVGLTKSLAIELGPQDVRVNAIAPGAVDGERIRAVLSGRAHLANTDVQQETDLLLGNQSLKRFVDASEVAAMAVFLSSAAARSISGQVIAIDGDMQRI
jgi:NAD(P)-dependent dehydrogenase (short-subunit alcohol dehydrogenase family)